MSGIYLRLVLIAFALCTFGCASGFHSSQNGVSPSRIPESMRSVKLDGFSITIPNSMEAVQTTATDSSVWEFRDTGMTLHIEQGPYAPMAGEGDELEYHHVNELIGGERCDIASFIVRKPNLLAEPAKKRCVIGRFGESQKVEYPIFISICFASADGESDAMGIIKSTRFSKK